MSSEKNVNANVNECIKDSNSDISTPGGFHFKFQILSEAGSRKSVTEVAIGIGLSDRIGSSPLERCALRLVLPPITN